MLVFFTNLSFMEFQVRYLALFLSNRGLRVVLDGMSSQEYPVNVGVLEGSILADSTTWQQLVTAIRPVWLNG